MSIRYCGLDELATSHALPALVPELQGLLNELGDDAGTVTAGTLIDMLQNPGTFGAFALVEIDGEEQVVGMGILNLVRMCAGTEARFNEVCVNARYQGKGIGDEILDRLIAQACDSSALYGELTCADYRTAARKLYTKKEFKKRHAAGVYVLDLPAREPA